jgi:hypothetical protein
MKYSFLHPSSFRRAALVMAIVVFSFPHPLYAQTPAAEEESAIKDIIEELYTNYEAIERRLEELRKETREGFALLTLITISVKKEKGFAIKYMEIKDAGAPLWNHIYSVEENSAMDSGGRHQFYKGEIKKGERTLLITFQYGVEGLPEKRDEIRWTLSAGEEPAFVEILFKKENDEVVAKPRKLIMAGDREYVEPE